MKVKDKDGKEVEVEEGVDSVRAGVTLPYSPEFAELESNTALLEKLREMTGGKSYADDDDGPGEGGGERRRCSGRPGAGRQEPAADLALAAVPGGRAAVLRRGGAPARRSTCTKAGDVAWRTWARLRGLPLPPDKPEFLERLQNRKAQVGEADARPGGAALRGDGRPRPAAGRRRRGRDRRRRRGRDRAAGIAARAPTPEAPAGDYAEAPAASEDEQEARQGQG